MPNFQVLQSLDRVLICHRAVSQPRGGSCRSHHWQLCLSIIAFPVLCPLQFCPRMICWVWVENVSLKKNAQGTKCSSSLLVLALGAIVCICACRRHVSSVVFLVRMFILRHSLSETFHFIVLVHQSCVADHFLFMSIWNINVMCGPFACTFLGV